MAPDEFSRNAQSCSLSPGERARVRASVNLTFPNKKSFTARPHPTRKTKLVLTTVLTPALSSEEREKRSPRFGEAEASDGRAVLFANDEKAARTRETSECYGPRKSCSLSPGERVRVRASVNLTFLNNKSVTARAHPGRSSTIICFAKSRAFAFTDGGHQKSNPKGQSMNLSSIFPRTVPIFVLVLLCARAGAQVNSGSNGSDGAFNPTTNTVINMADHSNGIYQYTSVNIPSGVTVTFIPNANNTPVTWHVQSNCEIDGTVDVSGHDVAGVIGGVGGPGGWVGGNAGSGNNFPSSGQGPGGGSAGYTLILNNNPSYTTGYVLGGQASFGTVGSQSGPSLSGYYQGQAVPGVVYGNAWLIPLTGGSGGGGDNWNGGGGGGGGILIAANNNINVVGSILANGGNGFGGGYYTGYWEGGGGSGGAIRLVAMLISGGGIISANGGAGFAGWSNNAMVNNAGNGRIRLDTFQNSFGGQISGGFTQGFQPIIIPSAGQGVQLKIISVGGATISASPSGILVTPDAVISGQQSNPISIVVNCSNLPLNTPITVTVKPANGAAVSGIGYNTTGTLASSTATVSLNMPRGGGIIYASAATGN